ncbi:MAG: DUF1963 domain-containing protein [Ruminococcus sp.]|nr:DUF1963 domain-containing protein [Ruminococcus sp.]
MNEMLKIYSKLEREYAEVYYDPDARTIRLPCYGMTAYTADDGQPEIEMEYNCRHYIESFENYESLYLFLSGAMSGRIKFRQTDDRTIIADGFTPVLPKNTVKSRVFRAVFNTVIGFPLAAFGLLLAVVGVFYNVDYSSPSLIFELCPLPLALAMTVIGVSMLHHGFAKKPLALHGVLIYGMGTVFTGFALAMLMVTYGDKSEDMGFEDLIGVTFLFGLVLAAGILMVVVGLRAGGSNGSTPFCTLRRKLLEPSEMELMTAKIKELTVTEAIEITTAPFGNMGVTNSKLGGLHYWDASMPYPENMSFIAQFNLSQLPQTKKLPHEGILQFFSDCEDKCRVVYHKTIDPDFTEDTAVSLGIPSIGSSESMPFEGECGLEFRLTEMFIGSNDVYGRDIIRKAAAELRLDVPDDAELDEFLLESEADGHHLLGYPCFTQYDPRDPNGKYNTLLFQLDSEMSERFSIMWGDFGVADFFINDKDLENLNFDDVFFTWDCC